METTLKVLSLFIAKKVVMDLLSSVCVCVVMFCFNLTHDAPMCRATYSVLCWFVLFSFLMHGWN
jgi:hypothetical protein